MSPPGAPCPSTKASIRATHGWRPACRLPVLARPAQRTSALLLGYDLSMARIARVVLPGIPHRVVQRGVRSQRLFFGDPDRGEYLRLLAEQGRRHGLLYVAWCLMPNHVHLIVIPETETSLAKGIGEAHKAYTRRINFRQATRGYLFQGRFASCPLDERHLFAAVRYILRNPVAGRARRRPGRLPVVDRAVALGPGKPRPSRLPLPSTRAHFGLGRFPRSRPAGDVPPASAFANRSPAR